MNGHVEVLKTRPSFSNAEITEECRAVTLIDDILADSGALELEQLYDATKRSEVGRDVFSSLQYMTDFLALRTNAFDMSFSVVRNRSVEFREMFGYLVNYVCSRDPAERSIKDVRDVLVIFNNVRIYEVGEHAEDLINFVKRHPNFFELKETNALKLNPVCATLPSAWEKSALPSYPKGKIRYDRSIVLTGVGEVVSAVVNTRYIKIQITKGKWRTQTVYAINKNVSAEENIAVKYPVGTAVKVFAFRAYEAAQPWTAFKILAENSTDIWKAATEAPKVTTSGTAPSSVRGPSPDVPAACGDISRRMIVQNSVTVEYDDPKEREFFGMVYRSEMDRIAELDHAIGGSRMSFKELFDSVIEDSKFELFSHLKEFVYSRPHLYEASGEMLSRRPDSYRTEMLKVLHFVDELSKRRLEVNTLRKQMMSNENFVEEIRSIAERASSFKGFLSTNVCLFETAECCGEEYIWLRGTFIREKNIFIPNFRFSSSTVESYFNDYDSSPLTAEK